MYPLTVLGTRRLKIKGSGFHVPSATPFCFVAAGICGIPWLTAVSLQPRLLSSHGLPPCVSLASPSLLCVSVSVSKFPSPYKDTRPWIRAQLDYISKDSVPNKITVTGIGDQKVTIAFWGGHNSTHNIHRVCFFPSNSFSYHSVAQKSSCLWEKFGLLQLGAQTLSQSVQACLPSQPSHYPRIREPCALLRLIYLLSPEYSTCMYRICVFAHSIPVALNSRLPSSCTTHTHKYLSPGDCSGSISKPHSGVSLSGVSKTPTHRDSAPL